MVDLYAVKYSVTSLDVTQLCLGFTDLRHYTTLVLCVLFNGCA